MAIFSHLISVEALKSLLAEGECRLVDCRHDLLQPEKGRAQYLEGHIPGAIHVDMDTDLAADVTPDSGRHPLPDPECFAQKLERWGIGNATQVVAYDYGSGGLAARLWWMLRWLGHERVAVLDGGLAAWAAAGEPLATASPCYPAATFDPQPRADLVVTTEEIARALVNQQAIVILDARDEARFAGRTEPIDSVAGHIPGATNLPFSRSLDPGGFWRDPAELETMWAEIEDGTSIRPIVMCGSGVTACHLALSAAVAGRPEPRLYAGSWSEWIRDPGRPVVTGLEGCEA